MSQADLAADIIVPILVGFLGIIVLFWNKIQAWHRGRIFQKLIYRELEEFSPFSPKVGDIDVFIDKLKASPPFPEVKELNWTDYIQEKNFIHKRIFDDPSENRDFILSLHPSLVYCVSQFWEEVRLQKANENPNGEQFLHYLSYLQKHANSRGLLGKKQYAGGEEIKKVHDRWFDLITAYNKLKEHEQ